MAVPPALRARRRVFVLVGAVAVGIGALVAPPSAHAATPALRVAGVTGTSLTVAVSAAGATGYQLFASATRSDVYVANLARAHTSGVTRSARPTVAGLRYAPVPTWYRVKVFFGSRHWYSDILSVGLRPVAPNGVRVTSGRAGLWLTWSSGPATGFVLTQANDPALSVGRRDYTIRGPEHQFTPWGLSKGRTYYFWVRAQNQTTLSGYSARVQAVAVTAGQGVRVLSYNLLEATADGTAAGDGIVAPWAQRQVVAASLIRQANPDFIAIQEGAAWAVAPRGPRMVDTLVTALGGAYALARTEIPPPLPGYLRTGNYVLYKTATYEAVGTGGHWFLPYSSTSAYQVLRNRATGAQFLAVSVHLTPVAGRPGDVQREAQTKALIADAGAVARAAGGIPVIYAGDFNTDINAGHAFDGPGIAMRATLAADAENVAQTRVNAKYNSANQYYRTPPAFGQSIDHMYAPAGVAVRSWWLLLRLSGGRFVGVIPSDHNPLACDLVFPY